MKHATKKEVKALPSEKYTFDEYKKRFPPPSSIESETIENPAELGIKLAEKSLAKIRQRARHT